MKMTIEYRNARWLVNGKRIEDMNIDEKNFLDNFFREFKATIENYRLIDNLNSNRF